MKTTLFLLPAAIALAACASEQASSQLKTARSDYREAKNSPASQLELVALDEAQQALEKAEAAHAEDPGSYQEKSLAYVASHRARIAMAKAGEADAKLTVQEAQERHQQYQTALLEAQRAALEHTSKDLEQERRARLEAEKRTAAAMASLEELGRVQQDDRGTVLTLSGSVLFATGESELLPTARQRLDSVAQSLADFDSDVTFKIEGHTDSRGTDEFNQELSRKRAQSVADYLVSRGVDQSRIQTVGMGESQPVTTNDTPEGRANNRRVEIVIQDPDQLRNPMPQDQSGIPDDR